MTGVLALVAENTLLKNFLLENLGFGVNPSSANPTKWSNTIKQFVGKLPTNCLSVFDHFVKLAVKGLGLTHFMPLDSTKGFLMFSIGIESDY